VFSSEISGSLSLREREREYAVLLVSLPITMLTVQLLAQVALTSFERHDPWTVQPWRIMAHMLFVTTVQISHPVLQLILVKTNDAPLHTICLCITIAIPYGSL